MIYSLLSKNVASRNYALLLAKFAKKPGLGRRAGGGQPDRKIPFFFLTPSLLMFFAQTYILFQLYIMTLGCLAPYRRLGIGTRMLEHVLNIVKEDGNYTSIFLHVQVIS